jgi:hypothetical protein
MKIFDEEYPQGRRGGLQKLGRQQLSLTIYHPLQMLDESFSQGLDLYGLH